MKIISKFQDYYDSALAYGFENDRVLVRHNQAWNAHAEGTPVNEPPSVFLKKLQTMASTVSSFEAFGQLNRYEKRPKNAHLQITPIVFCVGGRVTKALWVLDVESVRLNHHSQWRENSRTLSYGSLHREPFLPHLNPAEQYRLSRTFTAQPTDNVRQDGPIFDAQECETLFRPWSEHYQEILGYSAKNGFEKMQNLQTWLEEPTSDMYINAIAEKVSIAVAHSNGIAINPRLKDWKFFKYWDASTCMQELSMFVGNMSHPDCSPEPMSDKYRVQSHGFDENSFRKQPTKHGLPKRQKRPRPDNFSP